VSTVNIPCGIFEQVRDNNRMENEQVTPEIVKSFLDANRIPIAEFERKIGVKKDAVRNFLNGKSKNPRRDIFSKIEKNILVKTNYIDRAIFQECRKLIEEVIKEDRLKYTAEQQWDKTIIFYNNLMDIKLKGGNPKPTKELAYVILKQQ